jgi:hypothetical protein
MLKNGCMLIICAGTSTLMMIEYHVLTHHRASWLGTKILLRQTSPESEPIYDLILSLYDTVSGDWEKLKKSSDVSDVDMTFFLEYAAMFLANTGNYRVRKSL